MAKSFTFDVEFDAPLSEVWRVVSDTDLIDGAIGVPAIEYTDVPQPDGTSRRLCKTRKLGFSFEYEEFPFTWIHEQMYEVERVFTKGAFKTFRHRCDLLPRDPLDPSRGCTVRTTFAFEPMGMIGVLASPGTRMDLVGPYKKAFAAANQKLLARRSAAPKQTVILERPVAMDELDQRRQSQQSQQAHEFAQRTRQLFDSPLIDKLEKSVAQLPDEELRRMQPKAFARRWHASFPDVLNSFLAATRAGLLKMRWDVICPHCRGDKQNLTGLSEVKERAFCSACNVDFDIDLDRSLEAVFTPHPQVREVPEAHYCLGGPGSTPHIVYQRLLRPGESHSFAFKLAPGRYRVRVTGAKEFRWVDVEADAPGSAVNFTIRDDAVHGADATVGSRQSISVSFGNDSGRKALVVMESVQWAQDSLSAGELVADQRFRDLFSNEVLAPGIKLAVEEATILFTDLVGSTAMYNALGDAKAFALVRTHFDVLHEIVLKHRGAIVKTIGDAIMAVFTSPTNALRAADELHRRTDAYVREHGHEAGAQLKIGIHNGACIAVTLNDKLDYFGTTVNLAARVQGLSEGGDIFVSESLAKCTNQCETLREQGWKSEPRQAYAKGFAQPVPVLRWTR